jgi:hypothetical protein
LSAWMSLENVSVLRATASMDERIVKNKKHASDDRRQRIRKDVDALFRIKYDRIVYAEQKFNNDHDAGKFTDIIRRFNQGVCSNN